MQYVLNYKENYAGQSDMMNTDELLEKLLDHLTKPSPVQLPVAIGL